MTSEPGPKPYSYYLARVLAFALVIGLTLGITYYSDRLSDFAALGYSGAFFAMLFSNATLILPAPGLIVVFALGSSLNPVLVGFAGALGATIGEVTGYLTGYSGATVIQSSRLSNRVSRWMEKNGTLTIFVLSAIPNPVFDLAGIIAGAGRMPLLRFLTVTFCGKSLQAIAIAFAGLLSIDWIEHWLLH